MAVTMSLSSVKGTYNFPADEMPIFSRRLEYTRQGDQGYSLRKRNLTLEGFFLRNNHQEICTAYQELLKVLNANNAVFVYNNGLEDIVNATVYVDDYSEPPDWKEYDGVYNIAMHYFEQPQEGTELGIQASYTSNGGTWHFDPTPNWAGGYQRSRNDHRGPVLSPSGAPLNIELTQTLSGWITAPDSAQMQTKVNDFATIIGQDGQLQYGAWANNVRIAEIQLPSTFPRDYCPYTIVFKYDSQPLISFSSSRSISRIHNHPKIIDNPYCGVKYAKEYSQSPQEITYNIKLRAYDVLTARTLLVNEAAALIIPNGVEMPGGVEVWDDMDTSVAFTCTKWYPNAVIANLTGT